jgi:hypothetical protein
MSVHLPRVTALVEARASKKKLLQLHQVKSFAFQLTLFGFTAVPLLDIPSLSKCLSLVL